MAGKLQAVAKLFLGTSVLAAGGGAYYGTTHGWHLPELLTRGHKYAQASAADLDAVASAWAEPATSRSIASSESSPIARSANPPATAPEKKPAVRPAGDRYAIGAASAVEEPSKTNDGSVAGDDKTDHEVTAEITQKTDKSESTPVVAKAESAGAEVAAEETTASDSTEPTLAPEVLAQDASEASTKDEPAKEAEHPAASAATVTPIARGQEPKELPSGRGMDAAALGGAIDAIASDRPSLPEPRQLPPTNQPAALSDASRGAKQAINGAPTTTVDRYSTAGAPAANPKTSPSGGVGASNPFATRAGAAPTPPAPNSDRIQPLPPAPEEVGDRLSNLNQGGSNQGGPSQGGNGLRPLQGDDTGNPMRRDANARTPVGSTPPRSSMSNQYNNRQLPPASEPSRNTLGESSLPGTDGAGKPGEKALEGPQQPTLIIQKYAPGEIQVGKTAKFVVQVRNIGAHAAENVLIRDDIPQGTKLISTSPNGTTEGSQIVWQLGKLSPGEDRTVEMQLMPTSEGEIGSVATVSYSAQASVKTKCTMPQLAVRMTSPSEVMIGKQQHVKIEVKNPGSGDATGVVLLENVPPNVKHAAGPALEFEIGTLRAGESRELDLVLTAEKAGKVLNTLTAKADGNLQVQQQVEFEVIAPALSVAVDGPERRYLERPATYEVSVENPGTAAAHNVQIVTKLPKGMRFVRANNMGEYDAATHAVYWSLAELPKGERGTVELVAMPTETGSQTLQVEGHAQQGLSDQKQRQIVVEGLAAIMFEVRDLEDPIEVGGETGYEIRVVNQGTKAATHVQVSIDLPQGLKVISAEGESAHRIQEGRLVFEPLDQLAPKADTVYKFRAQGQQAGDQRIMVQVNTDDLQQPIRREESTRVFGDQ